MLFALITTGAWAQTDVTATYITNADFSSTDGWTAYVSGSFKDYGNGLIGTYGVRTAEGQAVSTIDETHLATEYCFGFECRWSSSYASFNQTTSELPMGVYTLTFDVEDTNPNTSKLSYDNLFYVQVGTTKHEDTATEWMNAGKSSWTTHTISFTLEEASTATISFGYGTGSNNTPSKNTPTIHVSHLKLTYQSLLDGVKALWEEAKEAAEAAVENADYEVVTGEERETLNDEIAKDEPTTKEGYEEATAALIAATNAFTAAKAAYDAFYAIANSDYVTTLDYGTETKRQQLDEAASAEPTSAADAVEKTNAVYTALRTYYESHAMAENVEGAVDMTDHIANATNPTNNDGWTWTGNKNNPASNEPWTDADGTNEHSYFDGGNWGANSWTTTMEQTINIPSGRYLLTAKGRAAVNTTLTMAVGEESVELPHVGSTGNVFDRGWGDASLEFETTDGSATIKVTATSSTLHEWFSISNFRLVQLEEIAVPMADAGDYTALATAIADAEANTLGFDAGEYAPYNNVEALQALAAAKAIDPEATDGNTKEVVNNATSALTNATWTANTEEVNAIFDGGFETDYSAQSGNVQPIGWYRIKDTDGDGYNVRYMGGTNEGLAATSTGKALFTKFAAYYGWADGYTMPLNANTVYEISFIYGGWGDCKKDGYVTVKDKDGNDIELTVSRLPLDKVDADSNKDSWKKYKAYFTTGEAGNYVLGLRKDNENVQSQYVYGDIKLMTSDVTYAILKDTEAFEQNENKECDYVYITRSIKEGLNTVVLPFALDATQVVTMFGEGAEVYAYSENSEDANNATVNFNKKEEATIEANVPVLVKATAASTSQTVEGVIVKTAEAKVTGTNFDFVGVYAPMTVVEGDYFVSGGKLYKSTGATNLKGFRAYIKNKVGGEVKLCIDGVATSIDEIVNAQSSMVNGNIYNLAGQRVSKATKGIFIKNGRKVVVK